MLVSEVRSEPIQQTRGQLGCAYLLCRKKMYQVSLQGQPDFEIQRIPCGLK
jgi:hypothetical protein